MRLHSKIYEKGKNNYNNNNNKITYLAKIKFPMNCALESRENGVIIITQVK